MNNLKLILTIITLVLLAVVTLHAAEVKNITSGQSGERGFVQYDLMGKLGEKEADVTVILEIGGERYPADRLTLSGDYGNKIKLGKGKRFYWDFLKDFPAGFDGEVTWDLEVRGEVMRAPILPKSDVKPQWNSEALPRDPKSSYKKNNTSVQFNTRILYADPKTGLIWPRNGNIAGVKMKLDDAKIWVKKLNYAGYRDWRLPTKDEWENFSNLGGKSPSFWFNNNGFRNVGSLSYWSSSCVGGRTDRQCWSADLYDGSIRRMHYNEEYSVWPVRSGR